MVLMYGETFASLRNAPQNAILDPYYTKMPAYFSEDFLLEIGAVINSLIKAKSLLKEFVFPLSA